PKLDYLMGIEGVAAKLYFSRIFEGIDWNGRRPRIKDNYINLLLDIGYTTLFSYIDAMLQLYGFDTNKGNLHQEFYKRKSLTCDIIEPFRCIIDYKVRKMHNLGQVKDDHFVMIGKQVQIKYKSDFNYLHEFIKEIDKHGEAIFSYIQAYYRWFMAFNCVDDFKKFPKVFDIPL
ncbi:MAG: CRISPR-associated endonuclease Cas1, partial [Defluviitaleaceae bacterium]|nr:CRISPR-associated endonuclease Cas1 [Defluviitaleaceae bacterium]